MSTFLKSGRRLILSAGFALAFFMPHGLPMEMRRPESIADASLAGTNGQGSQEFEENIRALREGDSYDKQRAAIALGKMGDPSAVEALVKALGDEDSFVRDFSAKALGNLGDARAVPPLIKALDDESLLVRRSAAAALGDLKDPRALDPLIKALSDENFMIRRSAAEALGNLGDARAIDPLIKTLADEDSYIWNSAADALVRIGKPSIPKLVDSLDDWNLGPRIAEVLKSLNWQPSSDKERVCLEVAVRDKQALLKNWETTKRVLVAEAREGNDRQAQNAVYALIGIGRDEVLDELAKILSAKGDVEMAQAFLNCGNKYLFEAARQWSLKHGDEIKAGKENGSVEWGRMNSS